MLANLFLPVYLPWLSALMGLGMAAPILPLYLSDIDVNVAVLGWYGMGAVIGSVPSGSAIARVGERRVLIGAVSAISLGLMIFAITTKSIPLALLQLGTGTGSVAGRLSIQSHITRNVPVHMRARAMSLVGGTRRVAFFIGPAAGGLVASRFGLSTALVVAGAISGIALIAPLSGRGIARREGPIGPRSSALAALRHHRRLLLVGATGPLLIMASRTGRDVVVPLIGDDFGLTPAQVGFLVSAGTGADMLLLPAAGYVMDRFGRLFSIVPAFTLLGVGLIVLGAAGSATTVVVAAVIMGLGNGFSAGTMLTLGSDLAPASATSEYLAGFAAVQGVGQIAGPVIVGVMADTIGLDRSATTLGLVAFVAVAWISLVVGETKHVAHR